MIGNRTAILLAANKLALEHRLGLFNAKGINLETNISLPTIYKFLERFESEHEIVCVTPERERGRMYRIPSEDDIKRFKLIQKNREAKQRVFEQFKFATNGLVNDEDKPAFGSWLEIEAVLQALDENLNEKQKNSLNKKIYRVRGDLENIKIV